MAFLVKARLLNYYLGLPSPLVRGQGVRGCRVCRAYPATVTPRPLRLDSRLRGLTWSLRGDRIHLTFTGLIPTTSKCHGGLNMPGVIHLTDYYKGN